MQAFILTALFIPAVIGGIFLACFACFALFDLFKSYRKGEFKALKEVDRLLVKENLHMIEFDRCVVIKSSAGGEDEIKVKELSVDGYTIEFAHIEDGKPPTKMELTRHERKTVIHYNTNSGEGRRENSHNRSTTIMDTSFLSHVRAKDIHVKAVELFKLYRDINEL